MLFTRVLKRVLLIFLGTLVAVSFWISQPRDFLGDVGVFVGSGQLAAKGLNPYGAAAITPRGPGGVAFSNLSPPITVLFFQQVARVDPAMIFRFTYVISLLLYLLLLVALTRANPEREWLLRALWALAIFPFWFTLEVGQVYVALVALAAGVWIALDRERDDLAGLALGLLVAWKPNLILWPLLLFLAGRRRASLVAVAVSGALSVWPALVYGPSIYAEWVQASAATTAGIGGYGFLSYVARDMGAAWLGVLASLGLVIGAIIWGWFNRSAARQASEVGLIVSLLALPITSAGYLALLVPVFFGRSWSQLTFVAAAVLLVPWPFMFDARLPWPYVIALLLLLFHPRFDLKVIRQVRLPRVQLRASATPWSAVSTMAGSLGGHLAHVDSAGDR
jgi:hypothetical protein